MHYDFIEIGTADFDTLCQTCSESEIGISVEPVKECIDNLPNKSNVTKINAALVNEEYFLQNKTVTIFYVDETTIEREQLGRWLRGCNKVNQPHEFHTSYLDDLSSYDGNLVIQSNSRNLVKEGLVTKNIANCITWRQLFDKFNVTSVDYVKVDAEGADADIIISLMEECFRRENIDLFPKFLRFEISDSPRFKLAVDILQYSYYAVTVDPEGSYDIIATRVISENDARFVVDKGNLTSG